MTVSALRPSSCSTSFVTAADGVITASTTRAEARVTGKHRAGVVLRLSLREGRKREIKRMLMAVGHRVLRLARVSFAGITASGLKPGTWRLLTPAEIKRLTSLPDSRPHTPPSQKR